VRAEDERPPMWWSWASARRAPARPSKRPGPAPRWSCWTGSPAAGDRAVRRDLYAGAGPACSGSGGRGHPGGHVRVSEPRDGRRGVRGDTAPVLPGQRRHGRLVGRARRAVRGQPVPVQDLVPEQPALLYYSGSEAAGGFRDVAPPAPRGHRARGRGISGAALFDALAGAVRGLGIPALTRPPPPTWSLSRGGSSGWTVGGSPGRRPPRTGGCPATRPNPASTTRRCAGPCTPGPRRWNAGTPARCGSGRGVGWCWRPAGSSRTGRCSASTRRPTGVAWRWAPRVTTGAASSWAWRPGRQPASSVRSRCGGSSARRVRSWGRCWWTRPGGGCATSPGTAPHWGTR